MISSQQADRILKISDEVKKIDLGGNKIEFNVDQVRTIIRLAFPSKRKSINRSHSSYGLKHVFERVSEHIFQAEGYKYCSNDTAIEAFKAEGFDFILHGPNAYFNISEKEFDALNRLQLAPKIIYNRKLYEGRPKELRFNLGR